MNYADDPPDEIFIAENPMVAWIQLFHLGLPGRMVEIMTFRLGGP